MAAYFTRPVAAGKVQNEEQLRALLDTMRAKIKGIASRDLALDVDAVLAALKPAGVNTGVCTFTPLQSPPVAFNASCILPRDRARWRE